MAEPITTTTPDYTGVVDQRFFMAPLGGPQHPISYLDRFPEELYNKTIDSHLVRLMYALLGPAGVGWLRKNYLETRLKLEDYGVELTDLDKFYGDPVKFGRILEEIYEDDPSGTLSPEAWEKIRAKDAKYRNRALDYVAGARAGGTPLGMRLVARSGLGHEVEIFERYKYLYDQLTDDQIGMPNLGYTTSTEEMVVLPRREVPQNEIQTITFVGEPTGGNFTIAFPLGDALTNTTAALAHDASNVAVQLALEALSSIDKGDIDVTGGPLPSKSIQIRFTGNLAYKDLPQLTIDSTTLTGGTAVASYVQTTLSGVDNTNEVVAIPPRDRHYLVSALGRIKPVTTLVTYENASGKTNRQTWNTVFASSEQNEVVRYVTGLSGVTWPSDGWVETGVENKAPRGPSDLMHHYQGFHDIAAAFAYTELTSNDSVVSTTDPNEHMGQYTQLQSALYPLLGLEGSVGSNVADKAPADYAQPLTISNVTKETTPVPLINGIYPQNYQTLQGVKEIKYKDDQFWGSTERTEGVDYLEIDLGATRAVNYIYFEATQKPYDIEVEYDLLDQAPSRRWVTASVIKDLPSITRLDYQIAATNPWKPVTIWIENFSQSMVYTRFIRLKFTRRNEPESPFTNADGTYNQYSIEVKNLRVGRNVG